MSKHTETLIQNVRKAVVEGDYAQLANLLPILQISEAEPFIGDLAELRRLKAEAERTEACLFSALQGIRAARRRVDDVVEASRGLTTYDRGGHKATVRATVPMTRRV